MYDFIKFPCHFYESVIACYKNIVNTFLTTFLVILITFLVSGNYPPFDIFLHKKEGVLQPSFFITY